MKEYVLPELLLIKKPRGISSFTVIRQLRRVTGIRKFGHAGTLDPLASGLMLIGVEKGTKLLTQLVGLDKEYIAEVLIGEQRSTGDREGEIVAERAYVGDITNQQLTDAVISLCGEITLPVSAYSAIKKDGVPMYKRARKAAETGAVITDVPLRRMHVFAVEVLTSTEVSEEGQNRLLATIRFHVGSGTYIRSLAEELGARLGYPATLYNLTRTKVGEYRIEDATTVEELGEKFDVTVVGILPVKIIEDTIQKYVLVQLQDDRGLCLCGNPAVEWHKDIIMKMEADGLRIKAVLGGGRLLQQSASRTIYFWGKSSNYGEANSETVRSLLQVVFKDYKIFHSEPI